MIRGPIISPKIEPYLLIRQNLSLKGLESQFKKTLESKSRSFGIQKVIFLSTHHDTTCFQPFPPKPDTQIFANRNECRTSSDQFRLRQLNISFSALDSLALIWQQAKPNALATCANKNLKSRMLESFADQKSLAVGAPIGALEYPALGVASRHLFAKRVELLICKTRKMTALKKIGEKAVLAMKAFVSADGYGQFCVLKVSESESGRAGFLKRKMDVRVFEAEE